MTNKCMVKHVFPGGNTPEGFYSFYNYILPQEEANHIFCIKGGPGVGKSSFMKKVGKRMTDLGFYVEYHHCSSDPNSLDGIVIPDLKVALVDGTAPHIVDPKNPGAVDEVLNFGQFWDEDKIKKNKKKIIDTNKEISRLFNKAYDYLRASKEIYKQYEMTESKAFNFNKYNVLINDIIQELFKDVSVGKKMGNKRHLFAYALTPVGITEYRDTIVCNLQTKYLIKESAGASSELLMNDIAKEATKRGFDIECYHSPIKIEKIEDILIPELNISISCDNHYNHSSFEYDKEYDLRNYLNKSTLTEYYDEINEDKELFEVLLYKGLNYINVAKSVHDELETYYIPNMNFNALDQYMETIIDKILRYKK